VLSLDSGLIRNVNVMNRKRTNWKKKKTIYEAQSGKRAQVFAPGWRRHISRIYLSSHALSATQREPVGNRTRSAAFHAMSRGLAAAPKHPSPVQPLQHAAPFGRRLLPLHWHATYGIVPTRTIRVLEDRRVNLTLTRTSATLPNGQDRRFPRRKKQRSYAYFQQRRDATWAVLSIFSGGFVRPTVS
jgi:hypothetical protein